MVKATSPLVSIIIPVYNAGKYVAQTIESALAQTWENKEIIIINDGSTDNSVEIIKSFGNAEIISINQENKGSSAAKQAGLNRATGDFIQYLDADDILAPNKIELQVNDLLNQPFKIAVCNTAHFFEGDNYETDNIPEDDFFFQAYLNEPLNFLIKLNGGFDLRGGMIQPNAFLVPKTIADKAGPWNAAISPCPDEDGEYFSRIILNSEGIVYRNETLNYYRKSKNAASLSGIKNETRLLNLIESVWLKHINMLAKATSKEQITLIHNATYFSLNELYVNYYFSSRPVISKIINYQKQLTPSIKRRNYTLGGSGINFIARIFGWKFARNLQRIFGKGI